MKQGIAILFLSVLLISCASNTNKGADDVQVPTGSENKTTESITLKIKTIADALPLNYDSTLVFFKNLDAVVNISRSQPQMQRVIFNQYKLFYLIDSTNKQLDAIDMLLNEGTQLSIEELASFLNAKWERDITSDNFITEEGDVYQKMTYTDSRQRKKELGIRLRSFYEKDKQYNQIQSIYIAFKAEQ